jgi:hypothetical protein
MRRERERHLGVRIDESRPLSGESVDIGGFSSLIPVTTQVVSPQGINRDEDHIQVVGSLTTPYENCQQHGQDCHSLSPQTPPRFHDSIFLFHSFAAMDMAMKQQSSTEQMSVTGIPCII